MTPDDDRRPPYLRPVTDDAPPADDPGESTAWAHPGAPQQDGTYPLHDPDTEAAVLSALLAATPADAPDVDTITGLLTGGDFHEHRHELIYDATLAVYARGAGADPLSVIAQLRATHTLRDAGGQAYVAQLHSHLVPTVLAVHHAHTLVRYAERRAVEALGRQLLHVATHTPDDALSEQTTEHVRTGLARATPRTEQPTTWAPLDLTDALTGALTAQRPTVLTRRDGTALLYPGKVHSVSGEPGSGKSWAAILGVAQCLHAGDPALYVDFEDRPTTLVERLRTVGVPDDLMRPTSAGGPGLLRYVRPETALDTPGQAALLRAADGCPLAIIDGVTEAMGLHGLSLMDNEDVARFLALLPRVLADAGPAVLQVDHVVKNSEARGRYAIGGQHKLAGIDGVAYKAVVARPMARGVRGSTRLVIDKDRPGHVGPAGHTAAELVLDSSESRDGSSAFLWMESAAPEVSEEGEFRPTGLMEKISLHLLVNPGSSMTEIEKAVPGKAVHKRQALRVLVAEGYLATAPGPHNATHYSVAAPYTEAADRA